MLLAINERIKGWLGIFIIFLIAIPFALWGIESYVGGADEQFVAVIDGTEISTGRFDRDVSSLRQGYIRDDRPIPEDSQLKQDAIDRIINTTVLENVVETQGYQISDRVLADNMRRLFSVDGQFDADRYQRTLEAQGMTAPMFENLYRSELRVNQHRNAIGSSAIVPVSEVRRLLELQQQVREIRWLTLRIDTLIGDVEISDEEIQGFYEENMKRFMTDEKVIVEYVDLSADTISNIEIDEANVRNRYEDYVAQQKQREERKVSHILLTTDDDADAALEKIEELRSQLQDGADFAALAKEFSQDPGSAEEGGDLGWVGTGQMVKPFEDALFTLEPGTVSDVVSTEFGYHLIKVDDVRSSDVVAFEDKADELREQLRREEVDSVMYDLSELMANTAYENLDSLEPVAEVLDLPVQTSEQFTRNAGNGIGRFFDVRQAAFSDAVLQQGENSELIELAPDQMLVLRVKDYEEATPMPIDEVRERIVSSIRLQNGLKKVNAIADDIVSQLADGATFESVLRDGVMDRGVVDISRENATQFTRQLFDKVMSMPAPEEDQKQYGSVNLGTGDMAVIELRSVSYPEEIDEGALRRAGSGFRQIRTVEEFAAVLNSYKDKADIQINQKALEEE